MLTVGRTVGQGAADEGTSVDPDGRRQRGVASRHAILGAAAAVIVNEGVGGLTHRAVAEAAGVPLARVSYHYPKTDDLLVAATARYLEEFYGRLQNMATSAMSGGTSIVDACTDFLEELISKRTDEFLAMVEIRLALHRSGRAVDSPEIVDVITSFGPDQSQAASILAALFGFAVLASTSPASLEREQVKAYVEQILRGVK
jgi:AcrR family transcriptional regulator